MTKLETQILVASPTSASSNCVSIGWKSRAPDAWLAHARGLASILQERGMAPLSGPIGRNLFWVTFSVIVSFEEYRLNAVNQVNLIASSK